MKRKRKRKLENYDNLIKKNKGSDITFVKQVPLHTRKRLKRLSKIDDKVYFVKEVAGVRPTRTKENINKMKLITNNIEVSLDNTTLLLAVEFNFSPKNIK